MYEIDIKYKTDKADGEDLADVKKGIDPGKIEALIHIMTSLFRLFHFPKFTQIQVGMRRALSILNQLLFNTEIVTSDVRHNVLAPMINQISYQRLNRSNKQIISSILEMAKQKQSTQPEGGFQEIVI